MIEFSEKTKHKAYERSHGHCECTRQSHGHPGRCSTELSADVALYRPFNSGGSTELLNCEVICPACRAQLDSTQPVLTTA